MATEKRLIDAKPLMKNGWHLVQTGESNRFLRSMSLADVPTVDAGEVVHGYWIGRQLDNFRKYEVKCSECGWTGIENYDSYVDPSDFNYCPNCGAKMDGDGNA